MAVYLPAVNISGVFLLIFVVVFKVSVMKKQVIYFC